MAQLHGDCFCKWFGTLQSRSSNWRSQNVSTWVKVPSLVSVQLPLPLKPLPCDSCSCVNYQHLSTFNYVVISCHIHSL
jgi:hypothetical protein